jgi:hypothetical protein
VSAPTPLTMQDLAGRAWELYELALANANGVVVQPSMPILYFGDSEVYRRSPLKVVTVALNPSLKEFPAGSPWLRFPGGDRLSAGTPDEYLRSLDAYFRTGPYRSWFDSFEWLLRGMGASYYAGAESVALHTDIRSPVATNPTWSGLGAARALVGDGFDLWSDLVETFAPDVVLVSVARKHLLRLTPDPPEVWDTAFVLERANPYHVRVRELSVGSHRVPVVFGRAAEKPFGTVSHADRQRIGAAIRSCLDGT